MRILILWIICCCSSLYAMAQCNATITPLSSTTFCLGDSVKLVASLGNSYQWYLNGAAISGANTDTLTVLAAGSYEVEIDSNGCIDTSNVEVVTVNIGVPGQPGPLSGPDTTCGLGIETYSTLAVNGATSYLWTGISDVGQYVSYDTTVLPTITGYISYPMTTFTSVLVYVRARNACGVSSWSVKETVIVGPPEPGGHWSIPHDVSDRMQRVCPGTEYKLYPLLHGSTGALTDSYTYQWYENNSLIPGETHYEYTITRGGNYLVKVNTSHCGTVNVPKKVYQDVPNSITISPAGPLSYCTGNATPLSVSFDMTGVSDSVTWRWTCFSDSAFHSIAGNNVYSILPNRSGHYRVGSSSIHYPYGGCTVSSNYVLVSIPPVLEVTQIDSTLYATAGYSSYQWFESGVPITGATGQSYFLTYDGIYSVEATFSNGCIETSDTIDPNYILPPDNNNNTNQQNQVQKSINVYPNPSLGAFTVTALVPIEDKTANITITDMTGRVLFTRVTEVKDGVVKEEIDMTDNMDRFCVLKVRSNGSNKTTSFLKK